MIIVTGGAGFIGSNLIKELNANKIIDILLVDNLQCHSKFYNVKDLTFNGFMTPDALLENLSQILDDNDITAFVHLGACSSTKEKNTEFLMLNNFEYTKKCFIQCNKRQIPFIYASSASVYGSGRNGFAENAVTEVPLNPYALSKSLFDAFIMSNHNISSKYHGLRFFNVYGHREEHKKGMMSPVSTFWNQLMQTGVIKIFSGSGEFENSHIKRDFVFVADCVQAIINCITKNLKSGVYNIGSGNANKFSNVAELLIENLGYGSIEYVEFPENLKSGYQGFTCADINNSTKYGLLTRTTSLPEGIKRFIDLKNTTK